MTRFETFCHGAAVGIAISLFVMWLTWPGNACSATPQVPVRHAEWKLAQHEHAFLQRNGWHRGEYYLTVECTRLSPLRFSCWARALAHGVPQVSDCDWTVRANRVAIPRRWYFSIQGCIA
jgi:hypothetical protein